MEKTQDISREFYQQKAAEAKGKLVAVMASTDQVTGAFSFISDALAFALTNFAYEEIEARQELQNNYFTVKNILEKAAALKEAEDFVGLYDTLDREKAA